ncbi:replication factor c subunit 5, partial [Nannochloropsis gaditana]
MTSMDMDASSSTETEKIDAAPDVRQVQPAAAPDQAFNSMPWVEKYRPTSLQDLVAHEEIISILTRLIEKNQLPHLLFYGPPGTGKTSTILACAKQMYGASKYGAMTLELNASDERGIDVVRQQIKEFAATKRLFSNGVKLVILDEADHLTNDAQFALRRVIEKYTKNTRSV